MTVESPDRSSEKPSPARTQTTRFPEGRQLSPIQTSSPSRPSHQDAGALITLYGTCTIYKLPFSPSPARH